MRHEMKKLLKMVDELTTFCLENQADDVQIQIKTLPDREVITVKAYHMKAIEDAVSSLTEFLSYPREHEMEEYYWELAGETDHREELALVGCMIDEARIDYDSEKIYIELVRKK